MAKRKGGRSSGKGSSRVMTIALIVVIVLVSWFILSVAIDFPYLDLFPGQEDTGDISTGPAVLTPTPTDGLLPAETADPSATADNTGNTDSSAQTAAPVEDTTGQKTGFYTLLAYKDGQPAYNESMSYQYDGDETDEARLRRAMDALAPFLNYNIVFNSMTLDENGVHIDLSSSGAPFVKDLYYYATGIFAVDYPTYDSQVFGILDSICYTARECCGQSKAVYITMDGHALGFDGLNLAVSFSADAPYMGYSYYRENSQAPASVRDTGLQHGTPLTFAEGVRYYFKGTIGSTQADVTLIVSQAGSLVVLKVMSQTDTPIYLLNVEANKVLSSDESETESFTLYQDADGNLIGEHQAAGAALTEDVRLGFVGYELNQ